jgi:hypothetical protein
MRNLLILKKMKKIILFTILGLFLFTVRGNSQISNYTSFQYAVSFGSGDLGDYISETSFRGAVFEYRKVVNDQVVVGFDLGWNVFSEKMDYATYTSGNESLSGIQYRTQNEFPILVSIDYFLSSDKPLKPYIGFGIGTMYTERSTDMNLYRLEENPWQFALKPEVGLLYEISFNLSFKIAGKYYTGFEAGELSSQNYFSLSTGLAFTY